MLECSKLHNAILDNQDKSDKELILAVENAIARQLPFNHSAEGIKEACGITATDKDTGLLGKDFDKLSERVEALEQSFTKREMTFIVVKLHTRMSMLEQLMDKFADKMKP